jgi:hypothetical protein
MKAQPVRGLEVDEQQAELPSLTLRASMLPIDMNIPLAS